MGLLLLVDLIEVDALERLDDPVLCPQLLGDLAGELCAGVMQELELGVQVALPGKLLVQLGRVSVRGNRLNEVILDLVHLIPLQDLVGRALLLRSHPGSAYD